MEFLQCRKSDDPRADGVMKLMTKMQRTLQAGMSEFGYREYLAAYQAADKLKREGMTEDDTRRSVAQPVSTMDADLNRRYCAWAERRLSIQEQAVKDVFVGRPMSYVQK
ncbi:MAG: hypothetical protein U0744_17550 [Gemmataceae bacterium]